MTKIKKKKSFYVFKSNNFFSYYFYSADPNNDSPAYGPCLVASLKPKKKVRILTEDVK